MLLNSLRVGAFLGLRQLRHASKWTNGLIVFVMTLTFLNLVVVTGILVGLIEGASAAYRDQYSADVLVSSLPEKTEIQNTQHVVQSINSLPYVDNYTQRYLVSGKIEADYQTRTNLADLPDAVQVPVVGINPVQENSVTGLSRFVIDGRYLLPGEEDGIVMGNFLLKRFSPDIPAVFPTLENADLGDKVRLTVGDIEKELTIVGVLKSKIEAVSLRAYVSDSLLQKITNRNDFNVNEIAIDIDPSVKPEKAVKDLLAQGTGNEALVQTWRETQGQFFADISNTFGMLGNVIGSISLVVASITIFIVIFINAITRKKYIGILKGIGIAPEAIVFSYILQSVAYALIGSIIGVTLLYTVLVPYVAANPIDFPFSDGILVAPVNGTILRIGLLMLSTLVAGYLPAKLIIRKNTLDAILGR